MSRKLVVQIVGDASSLERTFAKSSRDARKFGRTMETTGRSTGKAASGFKSLATSGGLVSTKFLGAGGAVFALKDAVEASSDLAEQQSKTNVVFGRAAQSVQDWSQTTTKAFGISRRQALATASSFGALFAPIGIVGKTAAQQSEKLTELGADLASFYNTDVQDALDAIRSGIVGESEPLRRYGVLLSETRVQQEALTETGKKHAKALTGQEKALARVNLIFKDTSQAQGDFARTSGGMANQLRIAQANVDDLKVALGTGLIPVLTEAIKRANQLAGALRGAGAANKGLKGHLGRFGFLSDALDAFKVPGIAPLIAAKKALDKITGDGGKPKAAAGGPGGKPWWERALDATKVPPAAVSQAKRTQEQRNQWFDATVDRKLFRAGLQPLKQQLTALKQVAGLLEQRIKATKDITRKQNLEDQLLQVQADQKDVSAQLLQQQKDAAQRAKDAAQAALEKEQQLAEIQRQRRQAADERAMGWLEFALEKAQATKAIGDDIKATEKIIAFLKKQIRQHGRTLELVRQLWEMEQQLKELQGKRKPKRRSTGIKTATGLDFDPISGQLVRTGFGAPPPKPPPAATPAMGFQAGLAVNQMTVNMYGVQNVPQLETELHKRAKARSQPRRGP